MMTFLYLHLIHHVYVYYTCLLAQLSDVTFGVTGDNNFIPTQEAEAGKQNPQGLTEWTPDDVIVIWPHELVT